MKVIDILTRADKPVFTFEIVPPLRGGSVKDVCDAVETLLPFHPAYINITNHQSVVDYVEREDGLVEKHVIHKRPGTVALSALLQYTYHIPVVSHVICGGQSAEEIENTLIELHFIGIDNVFAPRGDPAGGQKRFIAQKGGWSHATDLVRQIGNLNHGHYLEESVRNPEATDFCIGVAGYPEKHSEAANLADDIRHLKEKVDAGASYVVTQLFYDNQRYFDFVRAARKAGITVPVIPGLKPLASRKDLETIPQTFHVDIPEELARRVRTAATLNDIREVGIQWAIDQSKELLAHEVPGIHYYTVGKAKLVSEVVGVVF